MKTAGFTVIEEMGVARVGPEGLAGVLDRTPILLGSSGDLAGVGQHAVRVSAVDTIQLLDHVQVGEPVPVDDDEIAAFDLRDAVEGKADRLVGRDRDVEDRNGEEHAVHERRGQDVAKFAVPQPFRDSVAESLVRGAHFFREVHSAIRNLVENLVLSPVEFVLELLFELGHPREDRADTLLGFVSDRVLHDYRSGIVGASRRIAGAVMGGAYRVPSRRGEVNLRGGEPGKGDATAGG